MYLEGGEKGGAAGKDKAANEHREFEFDPEGKLKGFYKGVTYNINIRKQTKQGSLDGSVS